MSKCCPKCNVVMVEEEKSSFISFWCPVCGYSEFAPKRLGGEKKGNES